MTTNLFRRLLACFGVIGLAAICLGQQTQITVPEGTRHFIVLIDSSWSMVANSLPPTPVSTKRQALARGERELTSLLYRPGRIVKGPWYRPNRDLISIVHYGIDTAPRANLAYIRLKNARLDEDYARPIERANTKLSRGRFLKEIHPTVHTNLNVLAWALPLGLSAARVSSSRPIQETFVILLNDMQMNDGSMVLESNTLGMHLTPGVRARLAGRQKLLNESVRLTDRNGLSGVWLQKTFGEGTDMVAITIFKAVPTTTNAQAGPLTKLHPLDTLNLATSFGGMTATIEPDKALVGAPTTLRILSDGGTHSKDFRLSDHSSVAIGDVPGLRAKAYLLVTQSAKNPLLGMQTYQVLYEQPVLLPSLSLIRSLVNWLLILGLGGAAVVWVYYHAYVARHFQLLLPGYVTPFTLLPISQRVNSRHTIRQPVENGERAAVLVLPSRFIRSIFYRNTTLRWDPRLRMPKLPADAESANLMSLPKFVEFIWQDRPPISGEFDLTIDRRTRNGRNQRAQASVRFMSLSAQSPSTLNQP